MRELENVIERAMILTNGSTLSFDPAWLVPEAKDFAQPMVEEGTLADAERRHILRALEKAEWRISGRGGAAEQLGLKPSTLRSRMEKLGVKRS